MIALTFTIHLQEPLLATSLEGDPNSSVSLPFIPASALRGALIARYLVDRPVSDAAADSEYRQLFFDGRTRYLHAYPLDRLGHRTLPTPQSLKVEKNTRTPVYDLSVEPQDLEQPKSLKKSFCCLDGNEIELYEPGKQIDVHTQRNRKMGRAVQGAGAVFRYESIAAGEDFGGVILCAGDASAGTLQTLLEQAELALGGSRGAGYGWIEIRDVDSFANWSETSTNLNDVPAGGEFTLTLLSDAIIRDTNGQYTAHLDAGLLGSWLRVKLDPISERTHAQSAIVGGFNRKWGLPLLQVPVARAGSVYVFRTTGPIPADRLARLVEEGIGERRVEGFGRLSIDWHAEYEQLTLREIPQSPLPPTHPSLSETSAQLAHTIAERMLRRVLARKLVERVNRLQITGSIANSQLSRLRVVARSALAEQDTQRIGRYLDALKETARKQLENTRIENQSLFAWLKNWLSASPDRVLHNLGLSQSDLPSVGHVRATWTAQLSREYIIRLVDGVMAKAIRERREL